MNFHSLHAQPTPLLLANVWDVASAKAAQVAGYTAIGTSSAAIADMYGYEDGKGLSFPEVRHLVKRLLACCTLPLTVDMEYGYGDSTAQILGNLQELAELGVAGVNLEDSLIQQGTRILRDPAEFASLLHACRHHLDRNQLPLFINVRTDTFLLDLEDARRETISRGSLYAHNGADGLFVPCITEPADIVAVIEALPLPLNVMCMPTLPDFDTLTRLGVKRISMGNAVHQLSQHLDWPPESPDS
jgi:2-methylisocitrate lyase-like PEP mutase family enzyme